MRCALLIIASIALIGTPCVAASAPPTPGTKQAADDPYASHVAEAAHHFGIPATWLQAIIRVESRGDQRAVSPKGALGLMQLMPDTWDALRARYGLGHDPFDPHDNILAGAAFLREMHDRYGSPGFLAAYNAGPGRYEDYRDRHRPLPAQTVAYVAALAPFIGDGAVDRAGLSAAPVPVSWTQAPLFIAHSAGAGIADSTPSKQSPNNTPPVVRVRDLSVLAPQSDGLFVALSTARTTP